MVHHTAAPQKLPNYPWIGKKPFYGWVIVACGALSQFFQGLVNQGFSTYLGPLQHDFGWSKAVLAGPRSVTQVDNSALGPIGGYLVDRFGPRRMVAIGSFIMGLGLILFGLTHSLWMFYVSNIIIDIGTALQGLLIMSVAVNGWFRRKRSIAQSVMLLGFSMGRSGGSSSPRDSAKREVLANIGNCFRPAHLGGGATLFNVAPYQTGALRFTP